MEESIAKSFLSEEDISLRKRYTGITPEIEALLKEVQPIIEGHIDELAEKFYEHLYKFEETKRIIGEEATLERLKKGQKRYLHTLFSGDYGREYIEGRAKIGEIHHGLGLGTRWFLGAVGLYQNLLLNLFWDYYKKDIAKFLKVTDATLKILNFDAQIAIEMYELSYNAQLRKDLEAMQIDRQVFQSITNGIIITDLDRKILRINPACERLTGCTAQEFIGQNTNILKSGITPVYVYTDMYNSLTQKEYWAGEVVDKKKDGTFWHCHLTIITLKDIQGIPTGYLGILRDITEEKWHLERIKKHAQDVEAMQRRLREEHEATIFMFAMACEAKDETTGMHVRRIKEYATVIARELNLPEDMAEEIGISSVLHDVGKLHIPDAILTKPGPLTPEEREVMKTHTLHGERILYPEFYKVARNIALCHHENFDGTGYPRGLKGADIPIEARITRVADVFDALATERPYKKAFSEKEALDTILTMKGKELDPSAVEAFERAFSKGIIQEIRRKYAREGL